MKKALITGITGQDGSYLAEFLLKKGYEVHGIIRRASGFNTHRIDHIYVDPHDEHARMYLHYGDLADPGLITEIVWKIQPDEIYHLGAQSHVRVSFDMPEFTSDITGLGTTRILEAIRRSGIKTRFYQASSSEMFGASMPPQKEDTPFYPRSPYAVAKVYAYWMTVNYREAYDEFACNGILFNHESPRRGQTFVTRKITRAIANMLKGDQHKIYLGNLEGKRDWGFAPEYVECMWLMLQQEEADDYVIGTGKSYSIREFLVKALNYAGVEIEWRDSGIEEKGVVKSVSKRWNGHLAPGDIIVEIDPKYFRPTETAELRADFSKARKKLGWSPRTDLDDLVKIMVDYDIKLAGLEAPGEGVSICRDKGFDYTEHKFSFYARINEGS
ncbi:MAG: GDP-mannose 4,6-dehydratase [Candidatus Omnitrophica bacterium]|nr:GDP-mannose 4,6-dehydratase [Candidatus Omnitrophota bacterium]